MPEGHTLHRLAGQLQDLFIGQQWRVSSPQGRFAAGAAALTDQVPQAAEAWGKHLFVHVGARIWQVHLGLYGAFSFRGDETFRGAASLGAPRTAAETLTPEYDDDGWIRPEPPAGAVRARIHNAHGWADLRGPATCAVLHTPGYEAVIARLGPDPLRSTPSAEARREQFLRNIARRRVSIAAALMDQAVIAGVGNIYRAESLFVEGVAPDTPANELGEQRAAALWDRLTAQLQAGVREGSIITLRPEDPALGARGAQLHNPRASAAAVRGPLRASRGSALRRHWVYQHQGTPCLRCGETIRAAQLLGRWLYWCPGCQV